MHVRLSDQGHDLWNIGSYNPLDITHEVGIEVAIKKKEEYIDEK